MRHEIIVPLAKVDQLQVAILYTVDLLRLEERSPG